MLQVIQNRGSIIFQSNSWSELVIIKWYVLLSNIIYSGWSHISKVRFLLHKHIQLY